MYMTQKDLTEWLERQRGENGYLILTLNREHGDSSFKPVVKNVSGKDLRPREIILMEGKLSFPADTPLYSESYQMLQQTTGTISRPEPVIGGLTDQELYRLPSKEGYNTFYNFVLFEREGQYILIGFASCRRFTGAFHIASDGRFQIAVETEGILFRAGEAWELEELCVIVEKERESALEAFGKRIRHNHEVSVPKNRLTGWCSWYCYSGYITKELMLKNMRESKKRGLPLRYIQIDSGYQAYTGDWLDTAAGFGGDAGELCREISKEGFTPAIWVAPFVAEADSSLFQNHPDWFVSHEDGTPLLAEEVTFRGWEDDPWYMLDPTNPGVQDYLEHVFSMMRKEWGCAYFKLDGTMWGAIPYGVRYDREKTTVEAYRMGMEAIRRGAGEDSVILGCNAPMWHSIGTVNAMRTTADIYRFWNSVVSLAKQGFGRNWQNNVLWSNDPDCIVLTDNHKQVKNPDMQQTLSEEEFRFHIAYILASGGMVLSGDAIVDLTEKEEETHGVRYDREKTTVEAYRMGMEAIRRGAGEDSVILGCNAPMWHSIGTVNAMRTTADIYRFWNSVVSLAKQGFGRNWQNNVLWSNDPDCIVLTDNHKQVKNPDMQQTLSEEEFRFHIAYILASGGMVLSGDAIVDLTEKEEETLKRVISEIGEAARFDDFTFRTGHTASMDFYFNYGDSAQDTLRPWIFISTMGKNLKPSR